MSVGNRTRLAHRVSYEAYNGNIGGLNVLHSCDVRPCINPQHLFLGTYLENTEDARAKGRLTGPKTFWARNHCGAGHEYTPENTKIRPRIEGKQTHGRLCQTCARAYRRRYRDKAI